MVQWTSPSLWIIIAVIVIILTFIGIFFNLIFGSKEP